MMPVPMLLISGALDLDTPAELTAECLTTTPSEKLPEQIRQMIGLTVNTWFVQREQIVAGTIVARIPDAVRPLIDAYRKPIFV